MLRLRLPLLGVLAATGLAGCVETVAPPPPVEAPKPAVIVPQKAVPCEVTGTCPPKPKPPAPFNIMGKVIGSGCPKAGSPLASYATCRNGAVTSIRLEIPAFTVAAKDKIFVKALTKYGAPTEDRRGGVPMRTKVMLPGWARAKTPPDLMAYAGKRSLFWWIDEVALHYLSVNEMENAVIIHLEKLDAAARTQMNRDSRARRKLEEQGKRLTDSF